MRKVWMVLVVAFGSLLVGAVPALAQESRGTGDDAERIGRGATDVIRGASGLLDSLGLDPQSARIIGYVIAVALGLLALRLLGLRRG